MSITAQAYEAIQKDLRNARREVEKLKAQRAAIPRNAQYQSIRPAKVILNNADGTYDLRILAGLTRVETNFTLSSVVASSPDQAFDIDDYVMVCINASAPHYIISASGGSDTGLLVPHSHDGLWNGGWAGFLAGTL